MFTLALLVQVEFLRGFSSVNADSPLSPKSVQGPWSRRKGCVGVNTGLIGSSIILFGRCQCAPSASLAETLKTHEVFESNPVGAKLVTPHVMLMTASIAVTDSPTNASSVHRWLFVVNNDESPGTNSVQEV